MKKSSLSLRIGCLFTLVLYFGSPDNPARAQSPAATQGDCGGVYLTAHDYQTSHLYRAKPFRGKTWSNGNDLLSCRRVIVDIDGMDHEKDLKDIYAVRCCSGNIVRIFNGETYTLLNPGGHIPLYKVVINSMGKGDVMTVRYFFSKDAAADIQELTVDNLRDAFSGNRKFGDALDIQFRSDRDLASYDPKQQCYKLDKVYMETH